MGIESILSQLEFNLGTLAIKQSVLTTWLLMLIVIILLAVIVKPLGKTKKYHTTIEGIYLTLHKAVADVLPEHVELVFPFIATLWIFILLSNLIGIVPGFYSPTGDLSVTAGLAITTFLSVHWFGIRVEGLRNYLLHYLKPSALLLPFHLLSEISRTLALAVRLFGNMMSLQLTALIVLMVAGFLVPIPILMLHIVEAVIQTYIFGMLALIYIAGGIQIQVLKREKEKQNE